jgi:ABC-type transport system substrate-binding protein
MRGGTGKRPGALQALAATLMLVLLCTLAACNNSPWPVGAEGENTLYNAFQERSPRYLDATASYSLPETPVTYSVYEPLYAYHHLKRPYTLVPRAAEAVVPPYYLDKAGQRLPQDAPADQIAESVYELRIRQGVMYAPHPAFAKNDKGEYLYHHLRAEDVKDKHSPWDFAQTGTRELTAEDFVYAFKRHATPRIETPFSSVFTEHIVGLKEYVALMKAEDAKLLQGLPADARDKPFLDFRRWPLPGVQALDRYTLRIRVMGKRPAWKYWMAMTAAAPQPWEADAFYAQPGMAGNGLALIRWPVGTGPFMLREFVQDQRYVLVRNPNYRGTPYPCDGNPGDKEKGLLDDCGKTMPFVDKLVSINIKERDPIKEQFKQGYLDVPEIERGDWGVDFLADIADSDETAARYKQRGYKFPSAIDINNWYLGFNWLDPVVGKGDTPEQQLKNRKLRQALSIAIDWEEGYGKIFRDVGGVAAHGPVPPGVFGFREDQPNYHNPITHHIVNGKVQRRPLSEARQLMVEAGYPDGRDAKTGKPLVLNYDYQRVPTPNKKAEIDWMTRQFAKLGVQLELRATDYNQFQEKMLAGKQQIFWWGWFGDYPDADNFLFLLYGPNSKAKSQGENAANYQNDEYDKLYQELQTLEDGPRKQEVMDRMVAILQADSPWAWGFWAHVALAFQPWVKNGVASVVSLDRAMHYRVDAAQRQRTLAQWNRPVYWPFALAALALAGVLGAGVWVWRRGERATALAGAATGASVAAEGEGA